MLPQEERCDEDGFQTPAGFQLIPLPYADDLRDNKSIMDYAGFKQDDSAEPGIMQTLTREEKHSAKLLVKNLNIDFDSRNFENPTIQRFYSGLQALALKEEQPASVQNLLEPDYEGLAQFKPVIDRFKDVFYDGEKEDPKIGKRPTRAPAGGRGRGRGAGANQSSEASAAASVKGRGAGGKGRGKKQQAPPIDLESGATSPKNKKRKVVKNPS